ncbi:probable methyltransferase-like protein 25 [Epargyreus clarus]|uniref:probable methyltransferase-like protein 25 n=1 Tax=Epargyreus clarus TaxID=520877 RepID=UPI003C2F735D
MAEEKDFNDVLEDIFLSEETQKQDSYQEGFKAGSEAGNPEGYHLGYHRGAELGRELGYYSGTVAHYLAANDTSETKYSDKILAQLHKVQELIAAFPRMNSEDHDILAMAETIRAQYKKACSLLKIPATNPFEAGTKCTMEATAHRIRQHLDSITTYLTPLLPLANCHMVEFLTQNHWEKLVPSGLWKLLDEWDLNYAVEKFWSIAEGKENENNELSKWVHTARSHCITINNEYCLSREQLQSRIQAWGGSNKPEITVKAFMNSKKSYEVLTMSHLVASLHEASKSTHCIEAGGGRGHLLVALSLGHGIPSLTVDCDDQTVANAVERVKVIQKQWHAIADMNNGKEACEANSTKHRFAAAYVKTDTDFTRIVREKFPEHSDDVKVLLTGLHTCGNLGPDSLRIFDTQPSTAAVLTVPCCYHLLSEADGSSHMETDQGFPMSRHLKGYRLGKNARMLAAQSIDRVVGLRQMPSDSLLYRATLEVIIKKHLPNFVPAEGKLKRVMPKCRNFDDYFKMADAILQLGIYDSLPDGYLTDVNKNMDFQKKKLIMFYFLRMCLAQVVESVILLDRLLFLVEKDFENVYLVKLFDPVLSPRCHSIVAIR